MYLKYLDFKDKNEFQFHSSVQWFDQNTLKQLQSQHKILQVFSFEKPLFKLNSGKIFSQPLMPIYLENMRQGIQDKDLINHMTPDQNVDLAEKFSNLLTTL